MHHIVWNSGALVRSPHLAVHQPSRVLERAREPRDGRLLGRNPVHQLLRPVLQITRGENLPGRRQREHAHLEAWGFQQVLEFSRDSDRFVIISIGTSIQSYSIQQGFQHGPFKFNRDFKRVLKIQQGFEYGP
jgi:hypothetical protein